MPSDTEIEHIKWCVREIDILKKKLKEEQINLASLMGNDWVVETVIDRLNNNNKEPCFAADYYNEAKRATHGLHTYDLLRCLKGDLK